MVAIDLSTLRDCVISYYFVMYRYDVFPIPSYYLFDIKYNLTFISILSAIRFSPSFAFFVIYNICILIVFVPQR